MPLAAFFTGQWYGPAAGAGISGAGAATAAALVGDAAIEGGSAGLATIVNADATRLVGQGGASAGAATVQTDILARARLTAMLSIGSRPSAVDIAGEILDVQELEGGLSLREALRIMAAALAGKVSGAGGSTVTIRAAETDHKARITATVDANGNRTAVTLDGST
jgi:hypothetical protein